METYTAIMMTVATVIAINVLFLLVLLRTMARDRAAERPPGAAIETTTTYRPAELNRAPLGTLSLLLVYLVVLLGIWTSVYFTLLQRS